jgi:hypothetical protein
VKCYGYYATFCEVLCRKWGEKHSKGKEGRKMGCGQRATGKGQSTGGKTGPEERGQYVSVKFRLQGMSAHRHDRESVDRI